MSDSNNHQLDSHNPSVIPLGRFDKEQLAYNITFDYKGFKLSFYTGTPAELRVFRDSDKEDITKMFIKEATYLSATSEGLRKVMNLIDIGGYIEGKLDGDQSS